MRVKPILARVAFGGPGKVLGLGALLSAVVACSSWPLARQLAGFVANRIQPDDADCAVWQPWNVAKQLLARENPFVSAEMYYPDGLDATLYLWNLGAALMRVPFYLATHPMRALALADLTFGLLNGVGGYVLGRVVGGCRSAGLAAAVVAAASPYAWREIAAGGRGEQGLLVFMLLAVAGLYALLRGGGWRVAVATGAAYAATAACYWYYGYFLALATAAVLGWTAVRRRLDRATAYRVLAAGGAALLFTLPAALPILTRIAAPDSVYTAAMETVATTGAKVDGISLRNLGWPLVQDPAPTSYGGTSLVMKLLLPLALLIPAVRRRSGWLAALGLAALVLSLGSTLELSSRQALQIGGQHLALPHAALCELPGMRRFWWAMRWLALAQVAAVGVAAAVVSALPGPRIRAVAVAVLAVVAVAECQWINGFTDEVRYPRTRCQIPAVAEMLGRTLDTHPVMQMPMGGMGHVKWLAYHRQPIDGGLGDAHGYMTPAAYRARVEEEPVLSALRQISRGEPVTAQPPDPESELCDLGFHYLVYWKREPGFSEISRPLSELVGRLPDHEDPLAQTWRLRPCARRAPLPR